MEPSGPPHILYGNTVYISPETGSIRNTCEDMEDTSAKEDAEYTEDVENTEGAKSTQNTNNTKETKEAKDTKETEEGMHMNKKESYGLRINHQQVRNTKE